MRGGLLWCLKEKYRLKHYYLQQEVLACHATKTAFKTRPTWGLSPIPTTSIITPKPQAPKPEAPIPEPGIDNNAMNGSPKRPPHLNLSKANRITSFCAALTVPKLKSDQGSMTRIPLVGLLKSLGQPKKTKPDAAPSQNLSSISVELPLTRNAKGYKASCTSRRQPVI